MSEFKGTPGPWYRGGIENNKVSINAGNYFVALVDESSAQMANAMLIAAAPELLEALQDALHAHDKHAEHSEWDFARAAITKALGG